AARFHSIRGLEILNSIEIPDDGAGLGFIGPDVPIPRSETGNDGNPRNRSRLRSAAAENAGTGRRWSFRQPQLLARGELKRNQAATYFGFSRCEVGNPNVRDALIVAGATPHRSAKDAASRDFLVPDNSAFTIGIDAIHRAALIARNENTFSAPKRSQNTRVTKIRVHDRVPRTVRFVLPDAGEGPPVVLRKLSRPQDPAGIHFERDNGVAHVRWRIGIVHTGAGVDHFVLQIQRWRRPDGNARWSPRFRARLILPGYLGLFLNQVRSPYPISRGCIQGDHAAAKCAALVFGTGCGKGLVSAGNRNVEPPALELRRAGNYC